MQIGRVDRRLSAFGQIARHQRHQFLGDLSEGYEKYTANNPRQRSSPFATK